MMKKQFISIFFIALSILCVAVTSCGDLADNGGGTTISAETIAEDALSATSDAYVASIQQASSQTLFSLSQSEIIKFLAFTGQTQGVTGRAEWNGQIGTTDNLDLDYDISFINYQVSIGGVVLDGFIEVAVSESNTACSATWNISELSIASDFNDYQMTSTGSGITLQGADCETMNLSGQIDISGDVTANGCNVSGTTVNPIVDCN